MNPPKLKIILLSFLFMNLSLFSQEIALSDPFAWNHDHLWNQLERRFVEAKSEDCNTSHGKIIAGIEDLIERVESIEERTLTPIAREWVDAENRMLGLAPLLAACPEHFEKYREVVTRLQKAVKDQAVSWPPETTETRGRLYRIIYGGRCAIEEILLQTSTDEARHMWEEVNPPSSTPSTTVHGIRVHSGDMLVTRGGAATSALIARGSDYPGNFSHAALVHVDAATGEASVIEALIESGVVISNVEKFLEDKKLRIMVLRLRPDLPAVVDRPDLAHVAAQWALDRARNAHIAYDFEMDFRNHDKLFCSEVIYAAYEKVGVTLWSGLSHISARGTERWLQSFGVKHFTTLEPSDLEYDPQLTRVVEWRDPKTLYEDHIDNAVTDVLLEGANAGDSIKYNRILLPVAWGLKTYSLVKNSMGGVGPVPQGMGCTAALRNKWYSKEHARKVGLLKEACENFKSQNGYRPPYWELVRLARDLR